MKRTELKMVVKALSEWNIDKRKGNYTLSSGVKLSTYLDSTTRKFLEKNGISNCRKWKCIFNLR